ncbi:MAG: hypothetical protein IOD12_10535 [Silvanigrellales bacterium]|nr:hypothetical protein [Silvanigrellales bacterium]
MSQSKNRKASVEKPQSEIADSEAGEHVQLEAGARRHLLGLGFPAAVALFATACGGSMFGNSRSKGSAAKPETDLGNGGLDTSNKSKPKPTSPEGGPGDEDDSDNPTKIEPGPTEPPPCSFQGLGIISPLPLLAAGGPNVLLKAYGDQADTMVVAKATNLVAGDVLMLVAKMGDTKGKVIARRKVTGLDLVQQRGIIIFDGVHLGVNTETLTTVVCRGEQQLRGADFAVDSIFQVKIKNPFPNSDQGPAYDIVDVFSIRGDSRYALKGAHPNYWDGSDLTICMAFGGPSASAAFGKQGAKGEENRNYVQATTGASWAAPSATYLPTSYVVCDAFGDILSASLTGNMTLLQTHSVLLVYVQDGSHFHRYFFHVG